MTMPALKDRFVMIQNQTGQPIWIVFLDRERGVTASDHKFIEHRATQSMDLGSKVAKHDMDLLVFRENVRGDRGRMEGVKKCSSKWRIGMSSC